MGKLAWQALAPFGVGIDHDLSQPLDEGQAGQLRALLRDHGLIIARRQALSMERQRGLCALFGPILLREGETGVLSNEAGGPSAAALSWHADAAYTEHPFDALSLHALDVVDDASSTCFVDAAAAWAELPADLRRALAGRDQEMISPHYSMISGRTCDSRQPAAQKRGIRPMVFTNPRNGRACLWVNELQTAGIVGMAWEDSRALLHAVYDHLYAPARVLEHRWRRGDLLLWDNIALQHARGSLAGVGPRALQRVIVGTHGVAPHVAGSGG